MTSGERSGRRPARFSHRLTLLRNLSFCQGQYPFGYGLLGMTCAPLPPNLKSQEESSPYLKGRPHVQGPYVPGIRHS